MATQDEIKKAYRELAHKLHPDKNKAENADSVFSDINEAHRTLINNESRKKYDFLLMNYEYRQQNKQRTHKQTACAGYSKPNNVRMKRKNEYAQYRSLARGFCFIFSLFINILLLDLVLPTTIYQEKIISRLQSYVDYNTVILQTESCQFPIEKTFFEDVLDKGFTLNVHATPIFNTVTKAEATIKGYVYAVRSHYNIYVPFGFFILIVFIMSNLGLFFIKKDDELVVDLAMGAAFFTIVIIIIMLMTH